VLPANDLLVWGNPAMTVVMATRAGAPVHVVAVGSATDVSGRTGSSHAGDDAPAPVQPAVEILLAGEGRDSTGSRTTGTTVGNRLRYEAHRTWDEPGWSLLRVDQRDPVTGLLVSLRLSAATGVAAVRATTTVTNEGDDPVVLQAVTSWCVGGLLTTQEIDGSSSLIGATEWLTEGRWETTPLRPGAMPDISIDAHGQDPRGRLSRSSLGGWSSGTYEPVAGLVSPQPGKVWLWQVEHNGSWQWEAHEQTAGVVLALSGPRDDAHGWSVELASGESFETVPVALVLGESGIDSAAAELTAYRRAIRAPHQDRLRLPLIFNDYMNTLHGKATSVALTPLIEAAAKVGAEVFCIDAGWYDDDGDWWDSVGAWTPSMLRFEHGLGAVLEHIRGLGMTPGLWLEPEVIGVRSPIAESLPDDAFFQRYGRRLREHGRFHLDLRHPAARAHLDGVVDRLVEEMGVGYFKLDYNIDPGVGTDVGGSSAGAGLLGHNRAYVAWLDGLLERHPDLILENCASGGLRSDYALLARLHLQSTSDQQDPLRYPPIAVSAAMSVLPEQAASWAYPQPEMTPEEIAFTLATGLTGRLYLSGHVDGMDDEQLDLVREAVATWRDSRTWLASAAPIWPAGLPGWDDSWLVSGLRHGDDTRLVLTRRAGSSASFELALPHLRDRDVRVEQVFPRSLPTWSCTWDAATGCLLVVATSEAPSARVLEVTVAD
jgi:alpha-galactosidase